MDFQNMPQVVDPSHLIGARFGHPVLIPMDGSQLVTRDPATGLPSGLDLSIKGVSGVVYDGSNRVVAFSMGGIDHTVTYEAGTITVNGARQVVAGLDPSGRIAAVA